MQKLARKILENMAAASGGLKAHPALISEMFYLCLRIPTYFLNYIPNTSFGIHSVHVN